MSSQSNKLHSAIRRMRYSMKRGINTSLITSALLLGLASNAVSAAIIEVIYVGVWDNTSASANPVGNGGPGVSAGQKYVISFSYDTNSIVTNNVSVPDIALNPTTNLMSTINLSEAGNSLDIYVPMAGLDAGSPFIYTQNETNHFNFGPNSPVPTLNFVNGSSVADKTNIIGLEFEGDFVPGAGDNVIQLFNEAPPGGVTSMTARILNIFTGQAAGDIDSNVNDSIGKLAEAVELAVDAGPDIVYNAASLIQTATASITQSNDLGAGRVDGEDFIDVTWSPAGTITGNNNEVGIAASGLTMTTSTTTWAANAAEQMTGKTASDTTNVSYANAIPTLNATATANGTNVDFVFDANDADLAVNTLIAGFEMLSLTAFVNTTIDATTFFADLFSGGSFSYTMAELFAEFGNGPHTVDFFAVDKAGARAAFSIGFDVSGNSNPPSIPEPSAILLMFVGLILLWRKQAKHL